GIWVASVKSGSAADLAGIEAGDVILTIEDLILSTDGTMADYCDILRTHNPGDVLNVEVLRYDDQLILKGQINGRKLEAASSVSSAAPTQPPAGSDTTTSGSSNVPTKVVTDDSGAIEVEVPASWVDVSGPAKTYDGEIVGAVIEASPNSRNFVYEEAPGIWLMVTNEYDLYGGIEGMATDWDDNFSCPLVTADVHEAGIWTGILSMYSPCGPYDGTWVAFIGTPTDYPEMYLAAVQIFVIDEDDAVAMRRALETLNVIAQLP
ncbi:MAG: PDZ domain-containing protein, partial [Anaerolineales bacterium]|nr:PDZ domain-containing protein [Anaerolineales bacterium]